MKSMRRSGHRVRGAAQNLVSETGDFAGAAVDQGRQFITERPVAFTLMTFATGILAGILFSRRK